MTISSYPISTAPWDGHCTQTPRPPFLYNTGFFKPGIGKSVVGSSIGRMPRMAGGGGSADEPRPLLVVTPLSDGKLVPRVVYGLVFPVLLAIPRPAGREWNK